MHIAAFISSLKAQRIGSIVCARAKKSQSLLDVGCGDMIITKCIADTLPDRKVFGIDVLDYRHENLPFVLYDGYTIPYKNRTFDTVYAVFTLHHCRDEIRVLREMVRVSTKHVIIIEDIYSSPLGHWYTCARDWIVNRLKTPEMNIPFHFHSDGEWKQIFSQLHCRVIHEQKIQQFSFFVRLLFLSFTNQKMYMIARKGHHMSSCYTVSNCG